MAIVATVLQQPMDVQDYDLDFSEWMPTTDTVASAAISCDPAMAVPPSYAISSPYVKVWVYQGGVSGAVHKITVRATTAEGRVKEVEMRVKIKEF